ncbi:MAG: site-specific DNA-methyltransferase [Candidatus Thorarchaeota archaeon]|nr:site-specific DNA-methyltransferase [Candidatus Thorarchaeota archaeon]
MTKTTQPAKQVNEVVQRAKKTLNDLDAKSWVKATKSWFVINPRSRSREQMSHPAKYPEELVRRFVTYFTKEEGWILDPFAGVGSTLVACRESDRNAVGIELNKEFVDIGQDVLESTAGNGYQALLQGDSLSSKELITEHFTEEAPLFDYVITSPPYWNMLRKSRGGNKSVHKEREEQGLKQYYSESENDLGNIEVYEDYIKGVTKILIRLSPLLSDKAYLTIVVQNMRDVDGILRPIAWDLARELSKDYDLRQEMIWCQDNKKLGCWGYPTTYVSNVHHHYCIILQKRPIE